MVKVKREFKTTAREFSIDTDNLSLLCVCGHHVNGSYIAILSLGVCAELSPYGDIGYNAEKIKEAIQSIGGSLLLPSSDEKLEQLCREIAEAIDPYTKQSEEELKETSRNIMGKAVE